MLTEEKWGKIHHEIKIIRSKFLNIRIYHMPDTYKGTRKHQTLYIYKV